MIYMYLIFCCHIPLIVLKFKRRTRFLGFFVQVLAKALQEGLTETALEWTNDTIGWIVRCVKAAAILFRRE